MNILKCLRVGRWLFFPFSFFFHASYLFLIQEAFVTSEEFGQDLEHVEVLQKKFDEFQKVNYFLLLLTFVDYLNIQDLISTFITKNNKKWVISNIFYILINVVGKEAAIVFEKNNCLNSFLLVLLFTKIYQELTFSKLLTVD